MKTEPTGFISWEAVKEDIVQCLEQMASQDTCAMFMIDAVRSAWTASASEDEQAQAQTLQYFRQVFSSLFRVTDRIAQVGKRRFLVFISGKITEESVYEKAEKLCEKLQFGLYGDRAIDLSVCVGVYMSGGSGLTCEKLYSKATAALTNAQKRGSGSFFAEIDDALRKEKSEPAMPAPAAVSFSALLKYMDGGVCLLELRDEIRIIYANAGFYQMIGRSEESDPLPFTLDEIGIHPDYRADYERSVRELASSGGVMSCTQCVCTNGEEKIWRHVRAVKLDNPGSEYPVVLELSSDISALVETQLHLRESNERLRVAFEQTPHVLWEVEVQNKVFHIYDVTTMTCRPESTYENFPESLVENGIIHPSSAANFRTFEEELLRGSSAGDGNFIMKDRGSGCYGWETLSYRAVCGQSDRPGKVVGVQRKLPDVSGISSYVFTRRPLPENLRHRLLARMQVNLTKNYTGEIWMYGADQTSWTKGKSYTNLIERGDNRLFGKNVGNEFHERFNRQNLLNAFERGEFWSTREHRRIDTGGNIRWMADLVNLECDPATNDVYMLVSFCDEQQRSEWERLSGVGAKRNKTDGLYSAKDAKTISEYLISKSMGTFCAMALIQIEGNIDGGGGDGHELRDFISVAFSFTLGTDCIAGWYNENSILAFFPDAGSKADIKRRVEDAFAYVRIAMPALSGEGNIRFVGGVIYEQIEQADYDTLLLRAAYLCDLWKNSAMDTVEFPEGDEDWIWEKLQKEDGDLPVNDGYAERKLSQEEQEIVLDCITAMLSSPSPEKSVGNVLRCIGEYYSADRVYILALSNDNCDVTMLHEWTGGGKYSIRNVMSGMQIGRIPLLARCRDKKEPVFAKSKKTFYQLRERDGQWCFMALPVMREGEVRGFLCVENAGIHEADAALLYTLLPYIQMDYGRFQLLSVSDTDSSVDTLAFLPNLRTFTHTVSRLNSDRYSAMGAVTLDIPDFSEINSSFGFEYGKEILRYCADTLRGIFGKDYIFRTWDAEFVALMPNTIQEVFTGRCIRLRTMLQRRYPRRTRIGYTWSDSVFAAEDLVNEARYIMNSEGAHNRQTDVYQSAVPAKIWTNSEMDQKYVLYLQPKVDMRSGKLVGAETLVRGLDEQGNIIPPSQFIDEMEKNGKIRDLDFFVFRKVLQQLNDWKDRDLPAVPVSVNISRRTLLAPTTLASVLAIHSCYPEVPLEQIRFEITETATNVEVATLTEIMQRFSEFGIEFELDDFGSKYASMSAFSNIKFRTVKLDRSLIYDLPGNQISKRLVESIVDICKNFGMICIAEGVETQQQEEALLKAGCIYGQGYYYSRPVPVSQFEEQYLKTEPVDGEEVYQ